MQDEGPQGNRQGRFGWLERAGDDFPYYDGRPVLLTGRQWAAVLGAVLAAFLILTLGGPLAEQALGSALLARLGAAVLFAGLPLAALAWAVPLGWRGLFRRVTARDVLAMFGFAALNLIVTFSVALALLQVMHMSVNPIVDVKLPDLAAQLGFLAWTAIQLVGEEALTILPFLAILRLGYARFGMGRKPAILLAWAGSSLIFALAHLPTYNWNLLQCLAVVGTARLVLTLAYVRTKSLWVSAGAHIVYDWTIFGLVTLLRTAGLA